MSGSCDETLTRREEGAARPFSIQSDGWTRREAGDSGVSSDVSQVKQNCVTEAAEMSDRAEVRGPAIRRRRTTVSGGGKGGAVGAKQANGSKRHDAGEKPPQCPARAETDEVLRHASNNGKAVTQMGASGQQLANPPRKQRTLVEDINDRLR